MRRSAVMVLVAAALVLGRGCREPTEVTVTIQSDTCASIRDVSITVGPDPSTLEKRVASGFVTTSTSAHECESDGTIGSLVVTPGNDTGAIVVTAQLGDTKCVPPEYTNCIVARRSFSFIEHVGLDIPIDLTFDCASVPCDAITSCSHGRCVDSTVHCTDTGTCSAVGADDAGADAQLLADAAIDASFDSGNDAANDAANDAPDDRGTDATIDAGIDSTLGVDGDAGAHTCTMVGTNVLTTQVCGGGSCDSSHQFCCYPGMSALGEPSCMEFGAPCGGLADCCGRSACGPNQICCISDIGALQTTADCSNAKFCGAHSAEPCSMPGTSCPTMNATICGPSPWKTFDYCQ